MRYSLVVAFAAACFWLAAASLSGYLGGEVEERVGTKKAADTVEAKLELASRLVQQARRTGDAKLLMDAVKTFHEVLDADGTNTQALLALADVCLELGIYDQAIKYYQTYLTLKPDDLRARTDYAYVLVATGGKEEAAKALEEVLGREPAFVPAVLTKAFLLKTEDRTEEARKLAESAKNMTNDPHLLEQVDAFLASFEDKGEDDRSLLSPALVVDRFFRAHKTLGPKIASITWPDAATVKVELKDLEPGFMPEAAQEKLWRGVKRHLKLLPQAVKIVLVTDKGEIMGSVEAGAEEEEERK